uniref:Y43F4A.1 protein n=1 Tax=Fopius arisanus TaxID=64838 RepID=A0A0C9QWI8_9HYME
MVNIFFSGVFLMFVAFSADARPQFQNDLVEVDGFVFDGPVERSNKFPNNNRRTFPDFPPPNPNPEITGTTTTTPSPDMTRCLQNCPVRKLKYFLFESSNFEWAIRGIHYRKLTRNYGEKFLTILGFTFTSLSVTEDDDLSGL